MNKDIIIRFRKENSAFINNFLKGALGGTLYGYTNDKNDGEVRIDKTKICFDEELSEIGLRKLERFFSNHIKFNYYMACFVKESEIKNKQMWNEYAGNSGFCLLYSREKIKDLIKNNLNADCYMLDDVKYKNEKTDIAPFINEVIKIICINKLCDNEEINESVANLIILNKDARKCVKQAHFCKVRNSTSSYPESHEIRLTFLNNNKHKNKYCYMLIVKPIEIIISNKMKENNRKKLIDYAKKLSIKYRIIDIETMEFIAY